MVGGRQTEGVSDQLRQLKKELEDLQNTVVSEKTLIHDEQKYLDNWAYPTSTHEMKEYARRVMVKPAIDYYVGQFNDISGDSYKF